MNTPARFLPTLFDRLSDEAPHQAVEGSAQRLYSLADYTASLVRDLETLVNTRQPALQANAVQAAWLQALNTLPKGQKPARVFYDSTDNTAGEIALTNALHALNVDGHGLELGNVEEGYDIGRRLGNTGVSSALVQINLATMASYQQGGASAVVYSGKDGSVTVQMVSPPNEERKARNHKNRGNDPFKYGAPGGKP